ncbi:MAG: metallophosphoesterase family protein [Pseudomonadales bacterium]|nr:metallophosphoesterase family protein [Pseudomonadales bacterium]
MPGSIRELWPQVFEAFAGVDAVLHAGDLHTLEIVDRLCEIAPTWVSTGNGDVGIVDKRLADTWTIDFDELRVGMIHRLPSPARKSAEHLTGYVERHFGDTSHHVVIYGHTHLESIHRVEDTVYINPGSPTLPQNQSLRLGTIATLEIVGSEMTATVLQLTDHGIEPHATIEPYRAVLGAASLPS